MTRLAELEGRLRRELPELADRIIASGPGPVDPRPRPGGPNHGRRVLVALMAAALVVAGAGAVWMAAGRHSGRTRTVRVGTVGSEAPEGPGSWTDIEAGPLTPRARPVAGWSGSEFIVAFGTTTDSLFAFGDGAAYDPLTGSWRALPMPGWGHPGAAGAFLDGRLYVVAKAGGARFDPLTGEWSDLPQVEDMTFEAVVAGDGAIWALGPTNRDPGALTVARLDPGADSWVTLSGLTDGVALLRDDSGSRPDVHWVDGRIVVWPADGSAPAAAVFDPGAGEWTTLAVPRPGDGVTEWSRALVTDLGLTVAVGVSGPDGSDTRIAIRNGTGWSWSPAVLPGLDPASSRVVGAGEWVVALDADHPPVALHLSSGWWGRSEGSSVRWVPGAATVWNGTQLLVWGGDPSFDSGTGTASPPVTTVDSVSALWTPG